MRALSTVGIALFLSLPRLAVAAAYGSAQRVVQAVRFDDNLEQLKSN